MKNMSILLLIFTSLSAFAAKPVKITPADEGSKDGQAYRSYTVECSNGRKQPITSWNSGKQWCVGEVSQEGCAKKQIKAAKVACKKEQ